MYNRKVYIVALVLVLVGALNWGLIAVSGVNAVTGTTALITSKINTQVIINRVVYALVGLSALYVIACCVMKKRAPTGVTPTA